MIRYGKAGISEGSSQLFLVQAMIKVLFGAGMFDDCFGELSFAIAMDPNFLTLPEEQQFAKMEELTNQRDTELTGILLSKLEYYVTTRDKTKFKSRIDAEVNQKAETPGGVGLLYTIGYAYEGEAAKALSRYFGIGKFVAETKQSIHLVKEVVNLNVAAVKLETEVMMVEEAARKKAEEAEPGPNGETTIEIDEEDMEKVKQKGLDMMWRLGRVEIDSIVRKVCKNILGAPGKTDSQDVKNLRRLRAEALEIMAKSYKSAGRTNKAARNAIPIDLTPGSKRKASTDEVILEKREECEDGRECESPDPQHWIKYSHTTVLKTNNNKTQTPDNNNNNTNSTSTVVTNRTETTTPSLAEID